MSVVGAWKQYELKVAFASPGKAVITVRCGFSSTVAQCACLANIHACIAKNGNVTDLGCQ